MSRIIKFDLCSFSGCRFDDLRDTNGKQLQIILFNRYVIDIGISK